MSNPAVPTHSAHAPSVRVRSIAPEELRAFSRFSARPDYTFAPSQPAAFETWLRRYWETGSSCPDWCFVAERDGAYVGSVVYEGDVRGRSVHVEHLKLNWRSDYLPLGRHLLHESLRQLNAREPLDYVNASLKYPPLADRSRATRARLLEHAGFTLRRQQLYYLWEAAHCPEPTPRHPGGVAFRPLTEVGEASWLDADTRVRQDSLVADMAAGAKAPDTPLFPPGHVLTDEPRWWQLAYDTTGALIGLVAPVRTGGEIPSGAIRWVGVVPEQRGRGYVDDLIAYGVATLRAAGIERVHAATHILNTPMQAAFPRLGFRHTENRWWYEFELTSLA